MLTIFLVLLCITGTCFSKELECLGCMDGNGKASCNDTHCQVMKCKGIATCDGSCTLILEISNSSSKTAIATCLPGGGRISVEDTYGDKDLGDTCVQASPPMFNPNSNKTTITCNCQSNNCNSIIQLVDTDENGGELTTVGGDVKDKGVSLVYVLVAVAGGFVFIALLIIIIIYRRKVLEDRDKRLLEKDKQNRFSSDSSSLLEGGWDEPGKHSCSTYKYSSSTGSQYSRGSKVNGINHNDANLRIKLEKIIGRGRYADVWKAKLQEDGAARTISVKVFRLPNYGAWRQEKDILSEKWMKHENVIEYFASEQHSSKGLQYWLITAYYSKGNLHNFLVNNTLQWNQFCDMAASIANGLAYLHSEHDSEGNEKLPVAHRDIKSCNILVKDDGATCVIADFGLSLKLDPTLSRDELANAGQVGTSRYMAPELLERLVNLSDVEMFKRVDMYAFALVMWELATRCDIFPDVVRPYKPPYGDVIADHPTKEQILLHVCRSRQRPEIRPEWGNHSGLAKYVETMRECWDTEPEARLTASCVYERITDIRNEETITEIPLSPKEEEALRKGSIEKRVDEIADLISTVV